MVSQVTLPVFCSRKLTGASPLSVPTMTSESLWKCDLRSPGAGQNQTFASSSQELNDVKRFLKAHLLSELKRPDLRELLLLYAAVSQKPPLFQFHLRHRPERTQPRPDHWQKDRWSPPARESPSARSRSSSSDRSAYRRPLSKPWMSRNSL